jgi:hypothetical protein
MLVYSVAHLAPHYFSNLGIIRLDLLSVGKKE